MRNCANMCVSRKGLVKVLICSSTNRPVFRLDVDFCPFSAIQGSIMKNGTKYWREFSVESSYGVFN